MAEAIAEGVRMRKAGETHASQPAFYRMLRDEGVAGERLTVCYSAFSNYIRDVLGYTWPYERTVASTAQIVPVTRSRSSR